MSKVILSIEQMASLNARQAEVFKRVCNGGLPIEPTLEEIQNILDCSRSLKTANVDYFPQFSNLLRPLDIQVSELCRLNKQMPKAMRAPDSWFNNLDTVSDHVQSVEDLEFFFVVPSGALKKVIEYQVKLIELTQPKIYPTDQFKQDIDAVVLDETADKEMFAKPGIYRRRINLVSYWNKKDGSSVDEAREQALEDSVKLAGLASVGAYALQDPQLYQSQDGENLPYFDIAEIRSGDDGSRAFVSFWRSDDSEVYFSSCGSGHVYRSYAMPSFV